VVAREHAVVFKCDFVDIEVLVHITDTCRCVVGGALNLLKRASYSWMHLFVPVNITTEDQCNGYAGKLDH